jgi:hypothetical protein
VAVIIAMIVGRYMQMQVEQNSENETSSKKWETHKIYIISAIFWILSMYPFLIFELSRGLKESHSWSNFYFLYQRGQDALFRWVSQPLWALWFTSFFTNSF